MSLQLYPNALVNDFMSAEQSLSVWGDILLFIALDISVLTVSVQKNFCVNSDMLTEIWHISVLFV